MAFQYEIFQHKCVIPHLQPGFPISFAHFRDIVCSEQLKLGTFIRNQIYAFMFGTFNFGTSCMYK